MATLNSGDTAWVLTASALVLLMTPALSIFYGGFMPGKRVLSTMLLSWAAFALLSILWPLLTYSLAFGPGSPYLGGLGFGLFDSADRLRANTAIPEHAFCAFQLAFAVVTGAVVSGSVAGRVTLPAWALFCALWHTLAYVPLARWVFYPGGWLAQLGVLDFAGGLVVETNSGVSGLVLAALVGWQERALRDAREAAAGGGGGEALLGAGGAAAAPAAAAPRRAAHAHPALTPHSVPLILLGSGLLHFGWLGFNAGSAITSGYSASRAFLNTHLAAAAGILGWAAAEVLWSGLPHARSGAPAAPGAPPRAPPPSCLSAWRQWGRGRPTAVGAATGVVVGLVAITPAAGLISPMSALLLGAAASLICYGAEHSLPHALGVWDTLNAFSGHGVAGMVGSVAVGLLAARGEGSPSDGLFAGGGGRLLALQCLGVAVAVAVAAAGTAVAWGCVVGALSLAGAPVLTAAGAGKGWEGEGGEGEGEGEGGEEEAWDFGSAAGASLN